MTYIPKPGQEPVKENLRPLTVLIERTKIFSTTILITLEDAMQVWIPLEQVGFMQGWQIILHITRVYQRIGYTVGRREMVYGCGLGEGFQQGVA